jgi:lipopolysaccharide transport system permease protein
MQSPDVFERAEASMLNAMATPEYLSEAPEIEMTIGPPKGWFDFHFRELWEYRELLFFFVWRDLKVRYKQTAIGALWAVLQPLMTMLVFSLFFGVLAHIPSNGLPYPIFYFSALLPWMYFAGALQNATTTIVEHQRVITKVFFPRLLLPLSAVISGLVDFAAGFVVLIGMLVFYRIMPAGTILWLPLLLLLAVLTALGAGLWLSALNAIYRDVRYVLPFLVQFWMFASPVAYPSTLIPQRWRWLYSLNPMTGVIEGFRWALTGSARPSTESLLASAVAIAILVVGGAVYFQKMDTTIADVV